MRRYTALVAAALACLAAAPAAFADSIVYEKDGNVWLANPDGTGQRQVTTAGGYSKPTQANDGTIVAVKEGYLHRLDRSGGLLNLAGDSSGSGPLVPALAPGGALVAYHYNNTGPITPGLRTALSYANRQTSNDEIFNIGGWINPSWIGDSRVLMFDGSPSDTLIYTVGVSGTQPWYEDPDLALSGGEIDASLTRLAATDTTTIRLYRLNSPPPAIDVEPKCDITGPTGTFFRPTWSPDGARLAWQEDDGIWMAAVNLDDCTATSGSLVIPGAKAPDWGPAEVGSAGGAGGGPGGGPGPGSTPGPTPGAGELSATAPKRIRLRALLRGLKVKVSCSCRATAKLLLSKKAIGKASKTVYGTATVKIKLTRAGKKRLKRRGKSVTVRVSGADKTVSRKVKILR